MPKTESPATRPEPTATAEVLVWDMPTRICHGLMALCFIGAWLTAGPAGWRLAHETLGYSAAGLAVFRIVWGFVGPRYARFSSCVPTPRELLRYLRQWPAGWGKRYLGHSPAAACGVLLALSLVLVLAATGGAWPGAHAVAARGLLVLAGLSFAAACFGSWRSGENRLRSMFTGTCRGTPAEAIRPARARSAWLLPAALLGFWCYQWSAVG